MANTSPLESRRTALADGAHLGPGEILAPSPVSSRSTMPLNWEGARVTLWLEDFMREYRNSYRTFKHGAVHGPIAGLYFATPMIGINALVERRGLKYVLITGGYWTICLALMGAIVCGWR